GHLRYYGNGNGRGGIRTHGTLLTYTHFPGVRLKPLGHPSQHRFAARSGESFLSDCGQLGSAWSTEEVLSGQGEIRTLDTGFTGMPVFETGAFNHSATCPAALQVIGRETLLQPAPFLGGERQNRRPDALRFEEFLEQRCAVGGKNAGTNFGRMVQSRVAEKIAYGSGHTRLLIPCSEYHALYSRQDD